MTHTFKRGFTLIELLVVIAIIGILASVVLASLNSARGKGQDAAIKSNLNNARAQAELYYDNNSNSYTNVCTTASGILNMRNGATNAGGTVTCNQSATAWAMSSRLVASSSAYYCVDSSGQAKTGTTALGSATACP